MRNIVSTINRLGSMTGIALTSAIVTFVLLVAFLTLPLAGSHKILIVLSDSMNPTFSSGSLLLIRPSSSYAIGDVISFHLPKVKQFVTHRIVSLSNTEGTWVYQTKGDANKENDGFVVPETQVLGKVAGSLPYIGKLVGFAKTKQGIAVLVLVPALIVLLSELGFLFSKIRIRFAFRSIPLRTEAFFLAGLMFGVVTMVGTTQAFFSDTAASTNNVFQADEVFLANHLVINEVYYRIASEHRMGSEAGSEWAELYNPTGSSINLNGWSVSDNSSCDNIPGSPIIPAGAYAILSTHTESEFRAVWTTVPLGVVFIVSPSAIGNGLANNDKLLLRNGTCPSGGTVVDHISWGSNTDAFNPSIPSVSSDGISSERNPDGIDSDTNADFVDSSPPTPGS